MAANRQAQAIGAKGQMIAIKSVQPYENLYSHGGVVGRAVGKTLVKVSHPLNP